MSHLRSCHCRSGGSERLCSTGSAWMVRWGGLVRAGPAWRPAAVTRRLAGAGGSGGDRGWPRASGVDQLPGLARDVAVGDELHGADLALLGGAGGAAEVLGDFLDGRGLLTVAE